MPLLLTDLAGPEPKLREKRKKLGSAPGGVGKENDMKSRAYKNTLMNAKGSVKFPQDHRGHVKFDLRIHDGEGDDQDNPEPKPEGKEKLDNPEENKPNKRTYDDAEVDRIVAKHKKEWEEQHKEDLEKAKDEARKYERMSKEQREEADRKKAEEESAKKDARIKELEQQIATDALRKSVAADVEAMPEGIVASQDFLDLVVTGDADTSNANVKKIVGIILADRKAQEEKRATGRTPKSYGSGNKGEVSEIDRRIAKYSK